MNSIIDFRYKYLKYKKKYIELKGGSESDSINKYLQILTNIKELLNNIEVLDSDQPQILIDTSNRKNNEYINTIKSDIDLLFKENNTNTIDELLKILTEFSKSHSNLYQKYFYELIEYLKSICAINSVKNSVKNCSKINNIVKQQPTKTTDQRPLNSNTDENHTKATPSSPTTPNNTTKHHQRPPNTTNQTTSNTTTKHHPPTSNTTTHTTQQQHHSHHPTATPPSPKTSNTIQKQHHHRQQQN